MSTSKPTVHRIPIAEAGVDLGDIAKRAHLKGEYFILEKDGVPVAGILDAEELEDYLELRDAAIEKQIAESRKDYEAGRFRDAGEFVAELRESREGEKASRPRKSA